MATIQVFVWNSKFKSSVRKRKKASYVSSFGYDNRNAASNQRLLQADSPSRSIQCKTKRGLRHLINNVLYCSMLPIAPLWCWVYLKACTIVLIIIIIWWLLSLLLSRLFQIPWKTDGYCVVIIIVIIMSFSSSLQDRWPCYLYRHVLLGLSQMYRSLGQKVYCACMDRKSWFMTPNCITCIILE